MLRKFGRVAPCCQQPLRVGCLTNPAELDALSVLLICISWQILHKSGHSRILSRSGNARRHWALVMSVSLSVHSGRGSLHIPFRLVSWLPTCCRLSFGRGFWRNQFSLCQHDATWRPRQQRNPASQLPQMRMSLIGSPVELCPVCLYQKSGFVFVLLLL